MSARKAPRRAPGSRLASPVSDDARTGRGRTWALAAAGVVLLAVVVAVVVALATRPADQAGPACGWDLGTPEGVAANTAYLARTADWLSDQPAGSATPPPPDSPYWHGDCPVDPDQPIGPPVDEAHDDGDHADD